MKNVYKALLLSSVSLSPLTLLAVGNPAAVYSEMMGYEYVTEEDSAGSRSLCILPDGDKVNAWDFFYGKVKPEYSYCAKLGLDVEFREVERDGGTYEEAYCVSREVLRSSDGSKGVPMIELMRGNGEWEDNEMKLDIATVKPVSSSDSEISLRAGYLPTSYDLRNDNGICYMTNVKNQGQCGSCYAFATTSSGESAYNKNSGSFKKGSIDNRKVLSESFIMWCMNVSMGCCGVYVSDMPDLLGECVDKGICLSSYFPYLTQRPNECTHYNDPRLQYGKYMSINPNNTSDIKSAIYNYGAVIAFCDGYGFTTRTNGVHVNNSTSINHVVSLVGWGTDSKEGEYWIMRNSWGSDWKDGGYVKLSVKSSNLKLCTMYVLQPKVTYENNNISERNEIPSVGDLKFNAHQTIKLTSGFVASRGCSFTASIVPHVTKKNTPLPGMTKYSLGQCPNAMVGDYRVTELTDIDSDASVAIYPNPTTGILYVRAQNGNTVDYIEVVNALGRVVMARECADTEVELDLTAFSSGIYFVKVTSGDETKTEKVALK